VLTLDEFFRMSNAYSRGALHFQPAEGDLDFPAIVRGESEVVAPLLFKQASGSRMTDLIGTGVAVQLFSTRFVDLLTSNGFSGWRTFAVDLMLKDGSRLPNSCGR
jgi:hypothetical protein